MFACPGFASAIVIGLLFLNRLLAFLRNLFLWVCGDLGLFFLVILIWYFAGALLGGDDRLRGLSVDFIQRLRGRTVVVLVSIETAKRRTQNY